jgi:hypothetical protein
MHILSILDSMLKLGALQRRASKLNFSLIESILCRRTDFWSNIEDITIISMLLTRALKARDCIEIEEIFEKAEIRLLTLLGNYDPEVS